MTIKDIVNRDLVNLANCESEPIHIPGSIQPHGFLIALESDTLVISFCSGNVEDYTGLTHLQLLGKSYDTAFGTEQADRLREYIAAMDASFQTPLQADLNGHAFYGTVHKSGSLYILEFEPQDASPPDMAAMYIQSRRFASYMEHATSLRALCQAVADHTRSITGYDRVMIYRFDEQYNGEVIAESKTDEVEAFLGLHYPHTDIPVQARILYTKNLIRVIADIDYKPVPIYTLGDRSNKDLDLTYSILRSVSPIHVQYLHNMGVGASMSISLMHGGHLWGLIACHHYSPRPVNNYARVSAMLQGHFMASQISVREIAEEYEVAKEVNTALDSLLSTHFALERSSFAEMVARPAILDLCGARGVALIIDGTIYKGGATPEEDDIHKLALWASTASVNGHYSSDHLSASYTSSASICDRASGIIYQALDMAQRNCIIWFRPETVHEITWAGEPDKTIEKDKNQLSPRKSFAAWTEVVKCRSREWKKAELTAAAGWAHALQKHINTLFLSEEETKYRMLNAKLQEAYSELENLNWISTHDLREPLRKIQVFVSKIMEDEQVNLNESMARSMSKIQSSAERMQNLINDVLSFSRLRHISETYAPVDLNKIIEEIRQETAQEVANKHAKLIADKLPHIQGISFLLHQLFSNLVHNSLKFARTNVDPVITVKYNGVVSYKPDEDIPSSACHEIQFIDNGIGFDNQYSKAIFKVFTRLHNQADYSGTGVGLALCKKIMENHKGYIIAKGKSDEGATFTLYFPE